MHCFNKLLCCRGKKIYEFAFQNIDLINFGLQLIWQFLVCITICFFKNPTRIWLPEGSFWILYQPVTIDQEKKEPCKRNSCWTRTKFWQRPKTIFVANLQGNFVTKHSGVNLRGKMQLSKTFKWCSKLEKEPLYLCKLLHCKMQLCGCETEDTATKDKSLRSLSQYIRFNKNSEKQQN